MVACRRGGGRDQPTVILLQDLHTQPDAQLAEGRILQHLYNTYNLKLVASEGATGPFQLDFFQQFPQDKALRTLIAKTFLTAGEMTGHEYQAITEQLPIQIYGVEEPSLYAEHGEVFKQILDIAQAAQQTIAQLQQVLDALKPSLYPKPLHVFLQRAEAFQRGDIALSDYVQQLTDLAQQRGVVLEGMAPNLSRLQQVQQLEASVNRQQMEAELQRLLPALSTQLQQGASVLLRADLETLTNQFQRQAIAPVYFYPKLLALAQQAQVDLTAYPALTTFTDYLRLSQAMQSHRIVPELEQVEWTLTEQLAGLEDAKTLATLSRHVALLRDLFSLKLTPDQLARYHAQRDRQLLDAMTRFLREHDQWVPDVAAITAHLPLAERFYALALQRDTALVKHTLQWIQAQPATTVSNSNGKTDAVLLVAGGFHTPGVTAGLRGRNVSYVVVSPTVAGELDEVLYHRLVRGQTASLEQLVTLAKAPAAPVHVVQAGRAGGWLPLASLFSWRPNARTLWLVAFIALLVAGAFFLSGDARPPDVTQLPAAITSLEPSIAEPLLPIARRLAEAAPMSPEQTLPQLQALFDQAARSISVAPGMTQTADVVAGTTVLLGSKAQDDNASKKLAATVIANLLSAATTEQAYHAVREAFRIFREEFTAPASLIGQESVSASPGGFFTGQIHPEIRNVIMIEAQRASSEEEALAWVLFLTQVDPVRKAWQESRVPGVLDFLQRYCQHPVVGHLVRQAGITEPSSAQRFVSPEDVAERIISSSEKMHNGSDLIDSPLFLDPLSTKEGLVLLKPPTAFNEETIAEIVKRIGYFGYEVVGARVYDGGYFIVHEDLIGQQYMEAYAGFSEGVTQREDREELRRLYDTERFKKAFGVPFDKIMVIPAQELKTRYGLTDAEITGLWKVGRPPISLQALHEHLHLGERGVAVEETVAWLEIPPNLVSQDQATGEVFIDWFQNELAFGLNQVGSGRSVFPVTHPKINGGTAPIIVVNGYVPGLLELFQQPVVDGQEQVKTVALRVRNRKGMVAMPWGTFRKEFLGDGNNPRGEKVPAGSVRRDAWTGELPVDFREHLNGQRNVAHCSSGPLEGMRELHYLMGVPIAQTAFGQLLGEAGYSKAQINYLMENPHVRVWEGQSASYVVRLLFRLTAFLDPDEALAVIQKYFPLRQTDPLKQLGKSEAHPTPVVVATVIDGSTLGPNGEITKDTKLLVGVRNPQTNLTHPDVVSTPTIRVPPALVQEVLSISEEIKGVTDLGLPFPERILRAATLKSEVVDSRTANAHHPLMLIAEFLLARKLGLAEALESKELVYTVTAASLLDGVVFYPNDKDEKRAPEQQQRIERHANQTILGGSTEALAEYHRMLGVQIVVNNAAAVPSLTAAYAPMGWAPVGKFMQMAQQKDVTELLEVLGQNALNYCTHGLCITSTVSRLMYMGLGSESTVPATVSAQAIAPVDNPQNEEPLTAALKLRLLLGEAGYSKAQINYLMENPHVRVWEGQSASYVVQPLLRLTEGMEPADALNVMKRYFPPFQEFDRDGNESPTVSFEEFLELQRKHADGALTTQTNMFPKGTVQPSSRRPVFFPDVARGDPSLWSEGLEFLKAGKVAVIRLGGGTGGRFGGYDVPEDHPDRQKVLARVLRVADKWRSALEVGCAHMLWWIREHAVRFHLLIMGNQDNRGMIDQLLSDTDFFGLNPTMIYTYQQNGIYRVNPTAEDLLNNPKIVDAIRKEYDQKASGERSLDEYVRQRIEALVTANGEPGAIFRSDDGSVSLKPAGNVEVITQLILTRQLLHLAEQGVEVIVVVNGDDTGFLIDPAKLVYFAHDEEAEIMVTLVLRNVTHLVEVEGVEYYVVTRGDQVVESSLPEQYQVTIGGDESLTFRVDGEIVQVTVKGTTAETGGVPVDLQEPDGSYRPVVLEGTAIPSDFDQTKVPYYNANQYYLKLRSILRLFKLSDLNEYRGLSQQELVQRVRNGLEQMKVYVELKEVVTSRVGEKSQKRWAAQFVRYLPDLTHLLRSRFILIDRDAHDGWGGIGQ